MSLKSTNSLTSSNVAPGRLVSTSTATSSSILKHSKSEKHMQWWYFGPVALAIIMFLLMGTIFERRIEALWRNVLERRQAVLTQATECQEPQQNTVSLNTEKTPSQKTIASIMPEVTPSKERVDIKSVKLEPKSPL